MAGIVDLHTHSTASDGNLSPSELIQYAKDKNLSAIALTDHDTVEGLEEAVKVGLNIGIEVIPGIEINSKYKEFELHIIGLFIDYRNSELEVFLEKLRDERKKRNEKLIQRLNELGFDISLDEVKRFAGGKIIAKGHFIEVMLKKGYVKDANEAREKYFYEGGAAFIRKAVVKPSEAVRVIESAGGIPILAHPGEFKIPEEELKKLIIELKKEGIKGIEVYYYSYSKKLTEFLSQIAVENELLISGGSDFHGTTQRQTDVGVGAGNLRIEYNVLEKLKKYLNK